MLLFTQWFKSLHEKYQFKEITKMITEALNRTDIEAYIGELNRISD